MCNKYISLMQIFSYFLQNVNIMTEYKKEFPFPILFGPEVPKNVLAEWLSVKGVPQYHVAGRRGVGGKGGRQSRRQRTLLTGTGVRMKFSLERTNY